MMEKRSKPDAFCTAFVTLAQESGDILDDAAQQKVYAVRRNRQWTFKIEVEWAGCPAIWCDVIGTDCPDILAKVL